MFTVTFAWFTVYNIASKYTKQTVLKGLVAIAICVYWCTLGIYANRLASNLFASTKFVDSVRLHTRTIFKVRYILVWNSCGIGSEVFFLYLIICNIRQVFLSVIDLNTRNVSGIGRRVDDRDSRSRDLSEQL